MARPDLAMFFAEAGALKRTPRSGWLHVGVAKPESVADHSQRAALIGYALAELEDANPERVALMLLFHDLPEARLGDLNKIQRRYLDAKASEERIIREQADRMPPKMGALYASLMQEYESGATREAVVAKDADLLECGLQALEYQAQAQPFVIEWADNVEKLLKTDSAKKILSEARKGECFHWWKGLKKFD
ncbi:hypothetical protein AUJ14_04675 [Candidatus Micrarchaeota archaeon CG1_02_55_22]|nr:MAG: hypothetical protein AUJ14_04675 [Candidatus Micrarchaeota archaeon CG1_02_55_22]